MLVLQFVLKSLKNLEILNIPTITTEKKENVMHAKDSQTKT